MKRLRNLKRKNDMLNNLLKVTWVFLLNVSENHNYQGDWGAN